jgi:hypothetical protein
MSAPLAGKFQDHYALLGVDPKANSEAIQASYAKLAEKYGPDNRETGDHDKFEAIALAFEVLTDADLRAAFDKVKGIDQDDSGIMFAGMEFFDALGRQTGLRAALLCVLYDRRRKKPTKPSLSMRHIDGILYATNDELVFALFYLKARNLVVADDKSNLQITVDGMDFLERNHPAPEKVFPFIKPAAISVQPGSVPAGSAEAVSGPAKPPQAGIAQAESAQSGSALALSVLAESVQAESAPVESVQDGAARDAVNAPPLDTGGSESVLRVLSRARARR